MEVNYYTTATIHLLPSDPGIYQFYNNSKEIIYVGKAKNIKKRVKSYFSKTTAYTSIKTQRMCKAIHFIEVTIVNNEYEALLLENNLIKSRQPRYNILLRDDKTYPYISITQERFPKIVITRQVDKKKGQYYGPFTDLNMARDLLQLIKNLYTLRTCSYHLSERNIQKKRFKVCLAYHLRNCQGPCVGLQSEENYKQDVVQAAHVLKGNLDIVKKMLEKKMWEVAKTLHFEQAQIYKKKITSLSNYQAKSLIVHPSNHYVDVLSIVSDEAYAFLSYLKINHGMIVFTQAMKIKKKLHEKNEEILALTLVYFREKLHSTASTILTNIFFFCIEEGVQVIVPKIGDKKKLVDLALKNAFLLQKAHLNKRIKQTLKDNKVLMMLQTALQLKKIPVHIECFDNSNIQGENPVAAVVCFKNGLPTKKLYRRFHIKTVTGIDDFASMREIVLRRYKHTMEAGLSMPDLIIIDGGKGQLNAAIQSLKELDVYEKTTIISIAKKLEEIYLPNDPYPLHIDKRSPSLKLLQRIRNEAHRFAITFHRNQRSQAALQSELTTIQGIGPATATKLLHHFKSFEQIKDTAFEELSSCIGKSKAIILQQYFLKNIEK